MSDPIKMVEERLNEDTKALWKEIVNAFESDGKKGVRRLIRDKVKEITGKEPLWNP